MCTTNFKLGSDGEYLGLVDAAGAIASENRAGFILPKAISIAMCVRELERTPFQTRARRGLRTRATCSPLLRRRRSSIS
jgi:hypothetical protein